MSILIFLFFYLQLNEYTSIDFLKIQQQNIVAYKQLHPIYSAIIFFLMYIVFTALSLPGGASIMTVASGMIFGLYIGTLLSSFASTIGATCAFLVARFLFQEKLQEKFSNKLKSINNGIEKEGVFYLFTLRLVPAFPFFMVNLVMGLTSMKTSAFFLTSQLGMLAGTIIYVYAGTQLSQINSMQDIVSEKLLFSLILLGLFPLLSKKIIEAIKNYREKNCAKKTKGI